MNTVKHFMNLLNMNVTTLSKLSKVPYATVHELVNDVSALENCKSKTVFALAEALNVTVDDLLRPILSPRQDFENFKSEVCQTVKHETDLVYLKKTLTSKQIDKLFQQEWYLEAFYTLAMVDYLCRVNGLPLVEEYNEYRQKKLSSPVYPRDVLLMATVMDDDSFLEKCVEESIPEFRRFNILESDVRSVA